MLSPPPRCRTTPPTSARRVPTRDVVTAASKAEVVVAAAATARDCRRRASIVALSSRRRTMAAYSSSSSYSRTRAGPTSSSIRGRGPTMRMLTATTKEGGDGGGHGSPVRSRSATKTGPSHGAAAIHNDLGGACLGDLSRQESGASSSSGDGKGTHKGKDVPLPQLHLVSVRFPAARFKAIARSGTAAAAEEDEDDVLVGSALAAIERWKDDALGNGHDYFVPRPRTLRALNEAISRELVNGYAAADPSWNLTTTTTRPEVSVLSNCARFDVMVAVVPTSSSSSSSNGPCTEPLVRGAVARTLLRQVHQRQQQQQPPTSANWVSFVPSFRLAADDPSRVAPPSQDFSPDEELVDRVAGTFRVRSGPDEVARYLCHVSAGIVGTAPKTPLVGEDDAGVTFRPYSSRDAHILLQLKRTLDVTNGPVLSSLLRSALEAGKDCRNARVVPAILPLQQYRTGSEGGGRYGSIASLAPPRLVRAAIQQAREAAIEPAVRRYCDAWTARSSSRDIAILHRAVKDLVERHGRQKNGSGATGQARNATLPRPVRELLHGATVDLRRGGSVRIGDVVEEVSRLLNEEGGM